MKAIGSRLRQLRKSRNLSQTQMADLLDLKQPSINKYEQGTATPTVENLRKYADYFDVSMDYIFARTDDPQGKLYGNNPNPSVRNEEVQRLVELCFDSESLFHARLKQTLLQMMEEAQK